MRYHVTRARDRWTPGLPHPGYDEYEDGMPTGRVVGAGAIYVHDTTGKTDMTDLKPQPVEADNRGRAEAKSIWDRATARWRDQTASYLGEGYRYKDEILIEEMAGRIGELLPAPPSPTLQPSLRRDIVASEQLRTAIDKLDQGSRLTDDEIKHVLYFYSILTMAGDILGQRYALFSADVEARYRRVLAIAAERGFTQAMINMHALRVRDAFNRSPS